MAPAASATRMRAIKGAKDPDRSDGVCTIRCCAPCCTVFSFVGVLFCALIAVLYDKQPLVMDTSAPVADIRARRIPCLGAAGIYGATCAISAGIWYWELRQRKWQRLVLSGAFMQRELLSINGEPAAPYGTFGEKS